MSWLLPLAVLFIFSAGSGYFSAAETALFSLSKVERRRVQKKHPRLYPVLQGLLDHPSATLTTILIGNLLVNTTAAALVALFVLDNLGVRALGPSMALYTLYLIIVCEITPKVLAVRKNVFFAAWLSPPLRILSILFSPLIRVSNWVTRGFSSLVKIDKPARSGENVSQRELVTLVKIGEEEGIIDRQERMMIQKLFELGERPVREIMTPRVDMVGLDIEDSSEKHEQILRKYHYTHFPVFKTSADHILGYISVQQFILGGMKDLMQSLKKPLFVPESKPIDELLEEFKQRKEHFCICVDEFGGTAGLVTLEDILEEIFGEYHDEYAKVENPIRPLGPLDYVVDAKTPISDFNEFFKSHLEAEEASTLGGLLLEHFREVPMPGSVLKLDRFEFKIHSMVRQRILSVLVRRIV